MIIYSIPLIIFSSLAFLEIKIEKKIFIHNKIFYLLIYLFFAFFVGFRNEIGCDWEQYKINYNLLETQSWWNLLNNNHNSFHDIGYSLFSKALSYNFDFNSTVFILSTIFTLPLFIFCYQFKRPYLALTIAYPYFVVVIGMGPIRQAAAIGLVMMAIIAIKNKEFNKFFLFSLIASLFHFSAIIFTSLGLFFVHSFKKNKLNNFFKIIVCLIIFSLILHNYEIYYLKIYYYITIFNRNGLTESKSAFFIWIINILPMMIYLKNNSKFPFNHRLKKVMIFFSIYEIFLLFLIIVNNIIAYRFLLYCFPPSILIITSLPDLGIIKIKAEYIIYFIINLSIVSLFFWLKFATHSYCWMPYKNSLLNF